MKIAVLEPYIEGIGGAQKVIAQYCKFLVSKGHHVEIFTQRFTPNNCYPEFVGITINLLKPTLKFLGPFVYLFKKFDGFELIIANDWPTHFASFRNKVIWVCFSPKRDFYDLREFYMTKRGNKKKIITLLKGLVFKKLDQECAKRTVTIFTNSLNIALRIRKYYNREVDWIFNMGVYFNEFSNSEMEDYFISVGRLAPNKRTENVILSMKHISNSEVKLIIAGDGIDEPILHALAKGDDRITFLGKVHDNKKCELYSKAIALIFVPIDEDFGLTPIEAAASKITTIGVNEGGLKETIIDGKTGFLLSDASPEAIADKMNYLFQNKIIAKTMGIAAYNNCLRFDWLKLLGDFEQRIIDK